MRIRRRDTAADEPNGVTAGLQRKSYRLIAADMLNRTAASRSVSNVSDGRSNVRDGGRTMPAIGGGGPNTQHESIGHPDTAVASAARR